MAVINEIEVNGVVHTLAGGSEINVGGSAVDSISFIGDPQTQINGMGDYISGVSAYAHDVLAVDIADNTASINAQTAEISLLTNQLANANAIIHETVAQAVEETIPNVDTASIPSTITVDSTAYPVIDSTRMLLTEVKGNLQAFNQLINPAVYESDKTIANVTFTKQSDSSINVTITQSDTPINCSWIVSSVSMVEGHIYLLKGCSQNGSSTKYDLSLGGVGYVDYGNGCLINITTTSVKILYLKVYSGCPVGTYVFKPNLIDLTICGDDSLTLEQAMAKYNDYYPYDAGSIKSTSFEGVKVTGKNLVDISKLSYSSIISNIADSTGSFTINGAYTSVYNYRGFLSNLQVGHTYRLVTNLSQNISRNFVYLGSGGVWEFGTTHTVTESDLASNNFMTIYGTENVDVRYSGFMIIDETEDATHYEPYRETNLISLTEPQELKSAGTAQDRLYIEKNTDDEFYSLKKETKIGSVDLGTKVYTLNSAEATRSKFIFTQSDIKPVASINTIPNLLYTIGKAVSISATWVPGNISFTSVNSYVVGITVAPTITTTTQVQSEMNGVILYYELANPITEVLKNDLTFQQVSAIAKQGGTISIVGNDGEEYEVKPDLSAVFEIKYWQEN